MAWKGLIKCTRHNIMCMHISWLHHNFNGHKNWYTMTVNVNSVFVAGISVCHL